MLSLIIGKIKSWFCDDARGSMRRDFYLFAAFGAALEMILRGGVAFGFNNNAYHLPIIARLFDMPTFAHDDYIQTLRYFSSGIWMALRGDFVAAHPYPIFCVLLFVSFFLTFAGLLMCAADFGIYTRRARAALVLMMAASPFLAGYSYAGDGGLFHNYFTHSEMANGLCLILFSLAVRRRYGAALACNGAVFFINAFVGVWNLVPFGLLLLYRVASERTDWRRLIRDLFVGGIIFMVLASPVLWSVLHNPGYGTAVDFNYADYLRFYYPMHFFWGASLLPRKIGLILIALTGFVALSQIRGAARRPWFLIMLGCACVYVVGCFLPLFTTQASLLNLHLLRSGFYMHMFAALLVGVWVLRVWEDGQTPLLRGVLLPVVVVGLVTAKYAEPLALIGICGAYLLARLDGRFDLGRLIPARAVRAAPIVAAVWIAGWTGYSLYQNIGIVRDVNREEKLWADMGAWAQQNTAARDVFLLPDVYGFFGGPRTAAGPQKETYTYSFEYAARRQGYVEFKRGAAVMWQQSYYPAWRARIDETQKLLTLADQHAFARAKNIPYILTRCDLDDEGQFQPVYRNALLCVYQTFRGVR